MHTTTLHKQRHLLPHKGHCKKKEANYELLRVPFLLAHMNEFEEAENVENYGNGDSLLGKTSIDQLHGVYYVHHIPVEQRSNMRACDIRRNFYPFHSLIIVTLKGGVKIHMWQELNSIL